MSGEPIRPHCHGGPLGPECGEGESLCAFHAECSAMSAEGHDAVDMPPIGSDVSAQAREAL